MDQNINKKVEISESLRLFFVRQKKNSFNHLFYIPHFSFFPL